ncbi:hypothetical protein ES703_94313 [subsurface metagenome]
MLQPQRRLQPVMQGKTDNNHDKDSGTAGKEFSVFDRRPLVHETHFTGFGLGMDLFPEQAQVAPLPY